jgi:hypothetical protein
MSLCFIFNLFFSFLLICISCFKKNEIRFVKEEHVKFHPDQETYVDLMLEKLIPCYKRFLQEHQSEKGDKSLAAKKFLFHVLPFFAETALSSGIYFVKEYPKHPFSLILLVRLIVNN